MANSILVSMEETVSEPQWLGNVELFVQKALAQLEFDGEEISVLFCTDNFMQKLNNEYRHIDSPTDVLSFEDGSSYKDEDGTVWTCAGDIVISLDTLPRNAACFDTDEDSELKRLLVHGLLHLNGMDHGEEHIEKNSRPVCDMLVLQERVLSGLELEHIITG